MSSLDDAEKAMHAFCLATWRIRKHLRSKADMERLVSDICTGVEMAKAYEYTEEEYMDFIRSIGKLTKPPDPKKPSA